MVTGSPLPLCLRLLRCGATPFCYTKNGTVAEEDRRVNTYARRKRAATLTFGAIWVLVVVGLSGATPNYSCEGEKTESFLKGLGL